MNKFRKILIGAVAAAGIACFGGAAACSNAPDYYQLTFQGKGLDYVYYGALGEKDEDGNIFINGNKVKAGVEVKFGISIGANTVGTPKILCNGQELTPDSEGIYSFVMSGDSNVTAEGLGTMYNLTLGRFERIFDSAANDYVNDERWVTYTDEDGKVLPDEVKVEGGKPFKFKLVPSPYYEGDFSVRLGTEILVADNNGVYTVEGLTDDGIVSVAGLDLGEPFANRKDCGDGSAENPYLLSTPTDLYYLAALVNGEYSGITYNSLHYKLAADIDMKGEKLFTVGDASNSTAVFCGTFDGAGHTISNFRLTDEVVNQSTFATEYLPYVGIFGQASALEDSPCVIKNLNLKNYEISLHPAKVSVSDSDTPIFAAGSVVGFGVGVQITNCYAEGAKITSESNYTYTQFIGGIAGVLQSVYQQGNMGMVVYDTYLRACSADVQIEAAGTPFLAGGVVGHLLSVDKRAIAYAVNCVSAGSVKGARQSGGIAGSIGRFSTLSCCYSSADVIARNEITQSDFADSYAGGIVGYADEDSLVYSCVSANGNISATSDYRPTYAHTDRFVAGKGSAGEAEANSCAPVVLNNVQYADGETFTKLGWHAEDWNLTGTIPKPLDGGSTRYVKLGIYEVKSGAAESTPLDEIIWNSTPVASWNTLPAYIDKPSGTGRSWGYYFDEELKQRVPAGFVPLKDEKIYVGFADYSAVAGTYYISPLKNSRNGYIRLTEDGRAILRNGGLYYDGAYEYDGKEITLVDTCFTSLTHEPTEVDGGYYAVKGELTDGAIHFTGKASVTSGDVELVIDVKLAAGDFYGKYTDEEGTTYMFNEDGSGWQQDDGVRKEFVYTVDGNFIEIFVGQAGQANWTATVDGGVINRINGRTAVRVDEYAGVWKVSKDSEAGFEFDGKGSVNVTGKVSGKAAYAPATSGNGVEFTVGSESYVAEFVDGYLEINGVRYFPDDGFTGSWYLLIQGSTTVKERVDVTFEGQNSDGYGYATLEYSGSSVSTVTAQYDISSDDGVTEINLYVNDMSYGKLNYDSENNRMYGLFWSLGEQGYYANARFCSYDVFKGVWISDNEKIKTLTFNGKTANDSAEVVLVDANNFTRRGSYTVSATDPTSGEMTVNDKTYTITYDEYNDRVTFAEKESGSDGGVLARRDNWRGVTLYDGDDVAYVFDGKGLLDNGGTVTAGTAKYPYKLAEDGSLASIDGIAVTVSGNGFGWNGKTLVFKTGFTGEWYVSGTQKKLAVSEVGASLTATVSYDGGAPVEFAYNASAKTLTYVSEEGGIRRTTSLKLAGDYELSLVSGDSAYYCIRDSHVDEYLGKYEAEDRSFWTFDGLGNSVYGSGTATFTAANGIEFVYSYSVNGFGEVFIADGNGNLFIPVAGGAYSKGSETYGLIAPDKYYESSVFVSTGDGENRYVFDGHGGLWKEKTDGSFESAYSYVEMDDGVFELTDGANKKYTGKLSDSGAYKKLTIKPYEE